MLEAEHNIKNLFEIQVLVARLLTVKEIKPLKDSAGRNSGLVPIRRLDRPAYFHVKVGVVRR